MERPYFPTKNILQIDVEDWYCDLDINEWGGYENRVVLATDKILSILKETDNKATFFILGYVAEKFPELVKKIEKQGHEIASHGYSHKRITLQTQEDFEKDLLKSIAILEKITGKKIKGYRAPQFTIIKETLWAIDILKKHGLEYDSSVFPVRTPLYGIPDAPLYPYAIGNKQDKDVSKDFLEVPLSVYKIPFIKKNIPIAGGFYLRFFPYFFLNYAIKKINKSGNVAVCYIHPWELDIGMPKINKFKWYHYYNIKSAEHKFRKLLKDFKFISTEDWIEIFKKNE